MSQFDQFANQGGPAAENAEALAAAKRKTDEQLLAADYSGDLPEPLQGGGLEETDSESRTDH